MFHTIVDAVGVSDDSSNPIAPLGHLAAEDGKSLLCLLKDPTGRSHCDYALNPGPWRGWIDMEHNTCYNGTNHWSSLTDGATKYGDIIYIIGYDVTTVLITNHWSVCVQNATLTAGVYLLQHWCRSFLKTTTTTTTTTPPPYPHP